MSTDLSSINNTVNFQNSACRVLFAQLAFSGVLCRFCKDVSAPRVSEGFGSLQYFNIQGLQYETETETETENSMTHPTGKAENIVTYPLCAPAHPTYTYWPILLGPQINYMPDKSHVIIIIINTQGQIVQIHLIRKKCLTEM